MRMKLSILMPAYNEAATVGVAVKRVLDIRYPCEIEVIIVNDGSADNTREVLAGIDDPRVVATKILIQVRMREAIADRRTRMSGAIKRRQPSPARGCQPPPAAQERVSATALPGKDRRNPT